MAVPNPFLETDPLAQLGLPADAAPAALAPALAAAGDGLAPLRQPRGLALALLRHPWYAPVQGLSDEAQQAWLAYRQALAGLRSCWEQEGGEKPAHHDTWVQALELLLKALAAPAQAEAMTALLDGAGITATPELLAAAQADFLVEALLEPAAALATHRPARYPVEAAHLQTIRTLGELGLRGDDHDRLLRRVLRAAGKLWLEVERPDRAAMLLEELAQLEPGSASVRHYLVRAKLLIALAGLRKGTASFQMAPVLAALEELADGHPQQWEVRTQLADLHLLLARQAIDERRASDAAESLVKAILADAGFGPCAAMAGDIEGTMHEARLVGGLGAGGAPGQREAAASEQLKTTIRAGFSRGEMYASRPLPWRLFESWPQAEAARLWAELGLPLDGGTFPAGCLALVETIAASAPPGPEVPGPWDEGLRAAVRAAAPELPDEALDGPLARWVEWARETCRALDAPVPARDLLFLHRQRDRSPVAPPLGEGPHHRPVLGFGLRESKDGLQIESIRADGPAAQAGLQEGDLLLRIRGFSCPSTSRAVHALLGWQPGEKLELLLRREGRLLQLDMLPAEGRPVERLPQAELARRCEKLLGLRLDPRLKVLGAPRIGMLCQIREGDLLLRVEGQPLASKVELEQALRTVDMGQFLVFTVLRGGQQKLAKVVTLSFKE